MEILFLSRNYKKAIPPIKGRHDIAISDINKASIIAEVYDDYVSPNDSIDVNIENAINEEVGNLMTAHMDEIEEAYQLSLVDMYNYLRKLKNESPGVDRITNNMLWHLPWI